MKRTLALLLCLFLISGCFAIPAAAEAKAGSVAEIPSYKLMSQNLLVSAGEGDWGADYTRQNLMMRRVFENDPDVITFQEANQKWINYMNSSMEMAVKFRSAYSLHYKYRKSNNKEAVPVAYKTEKFKLLDSGHFWLSDTPTVESAFEGAYCHRICSWVALEDKETKEKLGVISIHFDLYGAARDKSPALILDLIKKLEIRFPGIVIMAAGDYNCNASGIAYKDMLKGGLIDCRNAAKITCNTPTFVTGSIIDFALMNEEALPASFKVLDENYGYSLNDVPNLSDHNGLLVEFSSKAENCGDVNGDGKFNTLDIVLLQRQIDRRYNAEFFRVDYNQDGRLNIQDATALLKFIARK